jgi:hypothetical protein
MHLISIQVLQQSRTSFEKYFCKFELRKENISKNTGKLSRET